MQTNEQVRVLREALERITTVTISQEPEWDMYDNNGDMWKAYLKRIGGAALDATSAAPQAAAESTVPDAKEALRTEVQLRGHIHMLNDEIEALKAGAAPERSGESGDVRIELHPDYYFRYSRMMNCYRTGSPLHAEARKQEILAYILAHATPAPAAHSSAAPSDGMATLGDWAECARISDLPAVDEALRGFNEDPTADNAICLVREILGLVAAPSPTRGSLSAAQRASSPATEKAGGLPPYGYAVEQFDGHITFFKTDPKGFRQKKWAEVRTVVHDLYTRPTVADAGGQFAEFDRLRKLLKVPGYCAGPLHTEREAFDLAVRPTAVGAVDLAAPPSVQGVPEGWQLVPVEPTEAMIHAADYYSPVAKGIYADMLAAAPAPGGQP